VLKIIPAGTALFNRDGMDVPVPYDVCVFSDPVDTGGQEGQQFPLAIHSLTPQHNRLTFLLEGNLLGQDVRVLVDTGATDNFVSDRLTLPPALNPLSLFRSGLEMAARLPLPGTSRVPSSWAEDYPQGESSMSCL
jgi:hypothetical protein